MFKVQPSLGTAGVPLSPAVQVEVRDAFGNPTAGTVTLALQNNPGSDTLQGTLTASTVAGVASFPDLTLIKAAAGYTLHASVPGTPGAISQRFTLQAASAAGSSSSSSQGRRPPSTRRWLPSPRCRRWMPMATRPPPSWGR